MKHHVVAHNLVEGLLCDVDAWSLVFHNDQWMARSVGNDRVTTTRDAVLIQGHLVTHQRGREALLADEPLHEVLANPFLRRQCHPAVPQTVPDSP